MGSKGVKREPVAVYLHLKDRAHKAVVPPVDQLVRDDGWSLGELKAPEHFSLGFVWFGRVAEWGLPGWVEASAPKGPTQLQKCFYMLFCYCFYCCVAVIRDVHADNNPLSVVDD